MMLPHFDTTPVSDPADGIRHDTTPIPYAGFGEDQPLSEWLAERGLDPNTFPPGTTAAEINAHPIFQRLTGGN